MGAIREIKLANGNIGLEITYGGKEAPFGGVDTSAPPAYIDPRCLAASDGFLVVDNKLVAACFQQLGSGEYPVLWNSVAGVSLLKIGTFYNSLLGQLNYALGYTAAAFDGPPSGVNYVFYMTSWNPANPVAVNTDVLPITLFDATSVQQSASITLDVIASNVTAATLGSGATGNVTSVNSVGGITGISVTGGTGYGVGDVVEVLQTGSSAPDYEPGYVKVLTVGGGGSIATVAIFSSLPIPATGLGFSVGAVTTGSTEAASGLELIINGPAGGPNTYNVAAWASGYTRQDAAASMVAAINAGPDPNVTASLSPDGFSVTLTANTPGITGNSITVQDNSTSEVAGQAPPFYFSARVARNLEGGQIAESSTAPRSFTPPASTAEVGGTLYIANVGPMILKYSGPGEFTTSTMYNGVRVLRKFAGSLIGLGLQEQLGTYTQNEDMIFAWSATEDLDEWAPVSTTGDVTGAGFEQLADIGDYLAGLIVSNATAFIIRAQGLSYATATGNATLPFDVNHIGLGDEGEGGQISNLACQYDQSGVFVGNTDIFQVSGQVSSIGQKIKAALFQSLNTQYSVGPILSAATSAVSIGGDEFPLVLLSVGPPVTPFQGDQDALALYSFNPSNGTWMIHTVAAGFPVPGVSEQTAVQLLDTFFSLNNYASSNEYNQSVAALAIQPQQYDGGSNLEVPSLFILGEGIPNKNAVGLYTPISNPPFLLFPQEEVLFGRDITIDALYVALVAAVSENVTVNFYINNNLYATQVLTPAQFNSLEVNPTELQIFSTDTGAGAVTTHSPQLSVQIVPLTDGGTAQIHFTKFAIFASYDPEQRPV